jgi:metal-sulfur cluster biosynthetic enzyme
MSAYLPPPLEDATVDLVWDPAWEPGMMSAEAKQKLGVG